MTRVMGFTLGFAGLMLTARTALAQRIKGVPIGGGDSDGTIGEAIPLIVLLLGLIVLAVVLVFGLAQMLFHGGLRALMWSVVGMVNVYEWVLRFRPAPRNDHRRIELEHQLEQERLAEGRSHVRDILRQRLPSYREAQIEALLDALKFTGYLRTPPGVTLRDYDPLRLDIDLVVWSPTMTRVDLLYDGKMFIEISVVPGDLISTAE